MKQILIATDGSPSAQEAVVVGLELAHEQGADVTFVHVTPVEEIRGGRGGAHALTHQEEIDESETALKDAAAAADAAGVSYELERFSGETVETIVALADSKTPSARSSSMIGKRLLKGSSTRARTSSPCWKTMISGLA